MKNKLLAILAILISLYYNSAMAAACPPETDPGVVCISTIDEFLAIGTDATSLAGSYMLLNDLDFADYAGADLSLISGIFTGTFDGNNFTIRNFTSGTDDPDIYHAIFSTSIGGVFKNIKLDNIHIYNSMNDTGTLLGVGVGVTMTNIEVSNSTTRTYIGQSGLLVGGLQDADSYVADISVKNSQILEGAVSGGVIGAIYGSQTTTVERISAENIQLEGSSVGGLIGWVKFGTNVVLKDSFVNNLTLTNVNNHGIFYGGGLVAQISDTSVLNIENSYANADVSISTYPGMIIAVISINETVNLNNVFFATDGLNASSNGAFGENFGVVSGVYKGETTSNMQCAPRNDCELIFTGFDFVNIWTSLVGTNNDMPILR